ncbi:hypothetical protein NADFUDRAFT_83966 [Nadsonia fulvescens var. elongata DSM 6958]|uniref:Uncharacterized protein n=1 Tax=Nadsonia fulvescens var. elongata DSM 6958 TaxID=857566 RepID=A0A1E3PEN5_9ASCO|nr:hypothetical protein NADFUDRAFT_83966 [Nadsonia fulvescens var. elongata DSM 6958]
MKLTLPTLTSALVIYLSTFSSAETLQNLPDGNFPLTSSEVDGKPYTSKYSFTGGTLFQNLTAQVSLKISAVPSFDNYVLVGFRAKDHIHDISSIICPQDDFSKYTIYYTYTGNINSKVAKRDASVCIEFIDLVSTWQSANGTKVTVDAGSIDRACFEITDISNATSFSSTISSKYSTSFFDKGSQIPTPIITSKSAITTGLPTFTFTLTDTTKSKITLEGSTYTTDVQVTKYITTCPSKPTSSATITEFLESSPATYTFLHETAYLEGTKTLTSTTILTTCPVCTKNEPTAVNLATSISDHSSYRDEKSRNPILNENSPVESTPFSLLATVKSTLAFSVGKNTKPYLKEYSTTLVSPDPEVSSNAVRFSNSKVSSSSTRSSDSKISSSSRVTEVVQQAPPSYKQSDYLLQASGASSFGVTMLSSAISLACLAILMSCLF